MRFKHTDSSCHFLELNYGGDNLNFLKLKQLLLHSGIESNPGPTQNDCKSSVGRPEKINLSENKINIAIDPKVQNCFFFFFFNTIQPVSLDIIKPWSVTCPRTLESVQKLEFEVNNDINVKVALCQGDITKLKLMNHHISHVG